jgi:hypothetical protein
MTTILIICLFFIGLIGIRYFRTGKPAAGVSILVFTSIGIFFVLSPEYTTAVANVLGVGRGADLVLYTLFLFILFLFVFNNIRFERYNRILTRLVRAQAILNPIHPNKLQAKANDSKLP